MDNNLIFVEIGCQFNGSERYFLEVGNEKDFHEIRENYYDAANDIVWNYSHIFLDQFDEEDDEVRDEMIEDYVNESSYVIVRYFDESKDYIHFTDKEIQEAKEQLDA